MSIGLVDVCTSVALGTIGTPPTWHWLLTPFPAVSWLKLSRLGIEEIVNNDYLSPFYSRQSGNKLLSIYPDEFLTECYYVETAKLRSSMIVTTPILGTRAFRSANQYGQCGTTVLKGGLALKMGINGMQAVSRPLQLFTKDLSISSRKVSACRR